MEDKQILHEIKELKTAFFRLIGTYKEIPEQQFSKEALDRAAVQFKKLSVERGEWVEEDSISKIIRGAPYNAGTFIRTEFGFTNCFKKGRSYYYNRKGLLALRNELKERNIDLKRYMDYQKEQEEFKKGIAKAKENIKGKKKRVYQFPSDQYDITSSPPKMPPVEIIKEDIKRLKEEYSRLNMADYVDIYRDSFAMTKMIYPIKKYMAPGLPRKCALWCNQFNYANYALQLVTGAREE